MSDEIKVLTLGAGFMGTQHAKAYEQIEGVRNVGIVTRNYDSSENLASILVGDVPRFTDFEEALEATSPDAVAKCLVLALDAAVDGQPDNPAGHILSVLNTPFTTVGHPAITTTFLLPRNPSQQRHLNTHLN